MNEKTQAILILKAIRYRNAFLSAIEKGVYGDTDTIATGSKLDAMLDVLKDLDLYGKYSELLCMSDGDSRSLVSTLEKMLNKKGE
jgi:hypothetical protein